MVQAVKWYFFRRGTQLHMVKIASRGRECPCCSLNLPEELYPWEDKTKTSRSYWRCIACRRDCLKSTCRLGWTWVGTKPYSEDQVARAARRSTEASFRLERPACTCGHSFESDPHSFHLQGCAYRMGS